MCSPKWGTNPPWHQPTENVTANAETHPSPNPNRDTPTPPDG